MGSLKPPTPPKKKRKKRQKKVEETTKQQRQSYLIPNAPRPMGGNHILPPLFHLLRCIIQVEVDQDSIDPAARMVLFNLSPYQFHAPDGRPPQL